MALHPPLAMGLPRTTGHLPSGGSAVDERELGGKNSQGNRVGSGDRVASVGMDPATEQAALTSLRRALSLSVRQSCHLLSSSFSGTRVFLVHGRTPQRNMHVCMCTYKLANFFGHIVFGNFRVSFRN